MIQSTIFSIVGVYILLGVLLLSLNIASLWRWWVKAGAIVVTAVAFVGSYLAITGLVGWPTTSPMPDRFQLLSTNVKEPDRKTGAAGAVYMWVQEINEDHLPVAPPRAYEIPYTTSLAEDIQAAQEHINAGDQIMGEVGTTEESKSEGDKQAEGQLGATDDNKQAQQSDMQGGQQVSGAGGLAAPGAPQDLHFSPMPAVRLPDKGALVLNN
ncbi:hypothetical protein GCM10011321_13870 [Youhaiella tibetensis]|uniref:Uncharacterized protein n=1 Tax=Paradevosia tibetensis TaxID=1447062 RepID=A0A5B9DMZ2_9HYPH|nr:hypothetical protein [Youhaiella tibetensis]QEE20483.1 hypothetical protein FNA67_10025 [Youhaiella tibetensis]GGF23776.1 hypothetical protein GCM10011321_13870 [Youhaiella tibetensis]